MYHHRTQTQWNRLVIRLWCSIFHEARTVRQFGQIQSQWESGETKINFLKWQARQRRKYLCVTFQKVVFRIISASRPRPGPQIEVQRHVFISIWDSLSGCQLLPTIAVVGSIFAIYTLVIICVHLFFIFSAIAFIVHNILENHSKLSTHFVLKLCKKRGTKKVVHTQAKQVQCAVCMVWMHKCIAHTVLS